MEKDILEKDILEKDILEKDILEKIKCYIISNVILHKAEDLPISLNPDRPLQWMFNFKTASLDKSFLTLVGDLFRLRYAHYEKVQICGMEAGALPFLAHIVATSSNVVNAFYIRKSRKKHDLANQVEGKPLSDIPIIIIDDLINRGNTVNKQIIVLKEMGFEVKDVFVMVRFRNNSVYEKNLGQKIKIESAFTVLDFREIIDVSKFEEGEILPKQEIYFRNDWGIKVASPALYFVIPKSTPVLDETGLYVCTDEGCLLKIDKLSGNTLWEYKIGFGAEGKRIFSSPTLYNGNVYFGGYDGNFYCIDATTGKRKWVFLDAEYIGSSPCIDKSTGLIYIGLEFGNITNKGGIAAINANTGNLVWSYYEMKGLTHASPCVSVSLGVVVCGCNDGYIYAFKKGSGKLLWKYKTEGEVKYSGVFCEKRKIVIIGSLDGKVYCLHAKTGKCFTFMEALGGFYSTPLLLGDEFVIGSMDKRVYCFDLKKKKIKWTFNTAGRIFCSPKKYKDGLLIGSNDGRLYYLDYKNGDLKKSIQLSERIVNAPAVENNTIYLMTHAQELYKFTETITDDNDVPPKNNYRLIRNNIDVKPFLSELKSFESRQNWHSNRANTISFHKHTKDIPIRTVVYPLKGKPTKEDMIVASNTDESEIHPTNYPHFKQLYAFLEEVASSLNGQLARVSIVRLDPHSEVYPHIDQGKFYAKHDRYHLVLQASESGSINICDGETQHYKPGEIWWFDNQKIHSARNDSNEDRIHVIFDVLPVKRSFLRKLRDILEKRLSLALEIKSV